MKKYCFLLLLVQLKFSLVSARFCADSTKKDTTAIFDLLKPTSAPAFILLGTQPNDIETPSSPTDIILSFANATDKFSVIPTSFALDINPFWVFSKKNTSYDYTKFQNGKAVGYNIMQTFRISVGSNTLDTTSERKQKLTQTAVGFKISILRGHLDKKSTKIIDSLHKFDANLNKYEIDAQRIVVKNLGIMPDDINFENKVDSVKKKLLSEAKISFKQGVITPNQFERKGFKLDLSGGLVYDFLNQKWDQKEFSKFAVWTTFGWELEKDKLMPTILGIARLQVEKNQEKASENSLSNFSYFDLGLRFLLERPKVNLSFEYVLRNKLQKENTFDDRNRFVFNFDYLVTKNQSITLSLGKNFDNQYYRTGNLIAALNFVAGFGNKRNLISP